MIRLALKRPELFQDVLCRSDYAQRVVARFANQIKSEYYGGNRSVSIEGIVLEIFIAVPHTNLNSTTPSSQRHTAFHSFLSDDSKKDAATNTAYRKVLISLLNEKKVLVTSLGSIWENTDGFA